MSKQTFTTGQILTAAQMTTLQANDYNQTVNAKVASYTLVATDAGTRITMSNAAATTITVNTSLFTAGDTLDITNIGAGVCTITAGTATVSTSSTLALKQYDSGQLFFTSTGVAIFFASDAADSTSPLTTKGDLYTFSTLDARLPVGTNNQTLVADSSTATGLKWATPAGGGGKVLQVVSSVVTAYQAINSATFVDVTNLTVTITPSAASSKVLVIASPGGWDSQGAGGASNPITIALRDGSNNTINTIWDWYTVGTNGTTKLIAGFATVSILHSPNTTSAFTYKISAKNSSAPGIFFNNNGLSTITALEIGA